MKNTIKTTGLTLFAIGCTSALAFAGNCGSGCDSDKKTSTKTVTTAASDKTLVAIAAGNKDFSTLVAAAKAAGLVEALNGDGPFTIFAPTNEAFAKLPEGTVETLLKPENKDKLAKILKYHVVPAKVMAADVKCGEAKTLEGSTIDIVAKNGSVTVDKANVIKTDIVGSNGVIHVIDNVILP
ncbi:MAG: fasciclin domain-containing protein [Verrucomicrobiae bacterium]|nr:fasciclin domain-containing protein [Verrucomicrobiae bacterium]NNJ86560.1 fasciclin domain-containing protein [Akkermansiaceae bacterium]